jgi:hypothetical protein
LSLVVTLCAGLRVSQGLLEDMMKMVREVEVEEAEEVEVSSAVREGEEEQEVREAEEDRRLSSAEEDRRLSSAPQPRHTSDPTIHQEHCIMPAVCSEEEGGMGGGVGGVDGNLWLPGHARQVSLILSVSSSPALSQPSSYSN